MQQGGGPPFETGGTGELSTISNAQAPAPNSRIQTAYDGEVAYVTLHNPPVNVIDFSMIAQIKAFLEPLRVEKRLCAIVFQASGSIFSAGVDVVAHLPDTAHAMIREFHSLFELLDDLSAPTVA